MYIFSCFTGGLLFTHWFSLDNKIRIWLLFVSIAAFIAFVYVNSIVGFFVFEYLFELACLVFLFEIGKLLEKIKILSIVFDKLSYASMVAYLFHRQYFGLFVFLNLINILSAYLLILPSLFVISYFVQFGYDKLLDFFTVRKQIKNEAVS